MKNGQIRKLGVSYFQDWFHVSLPVEIGHLRRYLNAYWATSPGKSKSNQHYHTRHHHQQSTYVFLESESNWEFYFG